VKLTFLGRAPTLELRDPLAETLGVLEPGETLSYSYEDTVKLSGHSCPTVAGAYLMTVAALRELYPDGPAVRGEIAVTVGGEPEDGSAGPMAQVIALLTGAATETGFQGLMGRFARAALLRFDPASEGTIRFQRRDTGATVDASFDPSSVPGSPALGILLAAVLSGRATADDRRRFGELWQERVERILTGPIGRVVRIRRMEPSRR
jgi:hypothetical protein